jgi:branched-chain amino acid aminotransferase
LPKSLVFGKTFTDHMISIQWSKEDGWTHPDLLPYGPISLLPSATCLHYASECFEGLKAYRDATEIGRFRLFRPELNMQRLERSAKRLVLPSFSGSELLKCIVELVKIDGHWIPQEPGYSLYLRPVLFATNPSVGIGPPEEAMLFVVASPVGPYFRSGFKAVNLVASDPNRHVRAWPGGTGNYKVGANYGPTVLPQIEAAAEGFQQILWLFGEEEELTEVGTMNCFVFWINEQGEKELATPPLSNGTILPGITRDSILELTRKWDEFKVRERKITMTDLLKAERDRRLLEMFGSGTACVVTPIKSIRYKDMDLKVPIDAVLEAGPLSQRLFKALNDLQTGLCEHSRWSMKI